MSRMRARMRMREAAEGGWRKASWGHRRVVGPIGCATQPPSADQHMAHHHGRPPEASDTAALQR